jgi:hypothetical protein
MDYEALAKSLGGVQEKKAEKSKGSAERMEISLKPVSSGKEPAQTQQAQPQEAIDYAKIAESLGGSSLPVEEPSTSFLGLAGAATRGAALPLAGAALGAMAGAPIGGVGAIPGALAGAGAATLAEVVGDPVVSSINSLLGTKYKLPTDALEDLLTRIGVARPDTEAERIVQATMTGATGAAGGAAAGKALQMAAGQASPLLGAVGQSMAAAPSYQVASGALGAASGQTAKETGAGTAGQIAATVAGGVAGGAAAAIPQAVKMGTQKIAQAIAPSGAGIREKIEPTFKESAQSIKSTISEKISPKETKKIYEKLNLEPDSTDVVKFKLSGSQVIPDLTAEQALKQGWKEGAIASIKTASDTDKKAMNKMLNIFELGQKSEKFRIQNRPADVLGETIDNKIQFVANQRKNAGKEIEKIAETQLKGQRVDYQPAINSFLNDLEKIGVKVEISPSGVISTSLKNSDIQGDKAAKRILNSVLERLSDVKAPDAYGVHNAKRFIDTQVSWGAKSLGTPLTNQAEKILKNLRRNLNESLGEKFPEYQKANSKYSETTSALSDIQKAIGTNINLDSENANKSIGTAARKLTSNYSSRVNMIDALDKIENTAASYGLKSKDNVVNQLIFVNELDRMFGAAADTSLKGQVSQAMETGEAIARGKAAQRAMDLALEKLQGLRGVNRENALKSMKDILKEKTSK